MLYNRTNKLKKKQIIFKKDVHVITSFPFHKQKIKVYIITIFEILFE